ncbi:hypothetical protein [Acrocarpospora catenulata]|uniref:hypothetical protein n=1 Tax=Acrocarpospora catenulata TaxID=2836182 RepID=UPI001BDB3E5E|nr:hypothetical protein [Acrocarpospora catenulata]
MPVVDGVAVAVVDVVDMITVWYGDVSAARPVLVIVVTVRDVPRRLAFIDVIFVHPVQATVVHVVDVIGMRYGDMPAPGPMHVSVIRMRMMFDRYGHWTPPH